MMMNRSTQLDKLEKFIPSGLFTEFSLRLTKEYKKNFEKIQDNQIKKLDTLKNLKCESSKSKLNSSQSIVPSKWLVNRTDTGIPEKIQKVLSLGHKFNPPIKENEIPTEQIICDIETVLYNFEDSQKIEIRNKFTNILTNFVNRKSITTKEEDRIHKDVIETKKFLAENSNLMVTKADKGNVTVVLDKQKYIADMEIMFKDNKTYKKISKCSTSVIQRKLNNLASRWENRGLIDKKKYNSLRSNNGIPAKAYGLPKIHKENCPFRPIVSCIGTPLYGIP